MKYKNIGESEYNVHGFLTPKRNIYMENQTYIWCSEIRFLYQSS